MSMLSMNIILVSLVSLVTAQPMSLTGPSQPLLSCNFLSCAGSILGKSSLLSSQLPVYSLLLQEVWRPAWTLAQLRRCSPVWRIFSTVLARETAWLVSVMSSLHYARQIISSYQTQDRSLKTRSRKNRILRQAATSWHVLALSLVS